MSVNVNDYYYVSAYSVEKTGPRQWVARARIIRKDNGNQVGDDLFGEGATLNSARMRALDNAKKDAMLEPIPTDWDDNKD